MKCLPSLFIVMQLTKINRDRDNKNDDEQVAENVDETITQSFITPFISTIENMLSSNYEFFHVHFLPKILLFITNCSTSNKHTTKTYRIRRSTCTLFNKSFFCDTNTEQTLTPSRRPQEKVHK